MNRLLVILLSVMFATAVSAETYRVISYNVENLFDTQDDSLKLDDEFTAEGARHWSRKRFSHKITNICRVIANIAQWHTPMLIGLTEVENEQCIKSLLYEGGLKRMGYEYLHHESQDPRGIDCVLLYNPTLFRLKSARFIHIDLPQGERQTREIVYATGETDFTDNLHILVCHLPSQYGGAKSTQQKRTIVKNILKQLTDSLISNNPNSDIIVMGDMNSEAIDDLLPLKNMMSDYQAKGKGTHKWEGQWTCLDQFYVSPHLLDRSFVYIFDEQWIQENDEKFGGIKPWRTYNGYQYIGGYSDHLPIYLDINTTH